MKKKETRVEHKDDTGDKGKGRAKSGKKANGKRNGALSECTFASPSSAHLLDSPQRELFRRWPGQLFGKCQRCFSERKEGEKKERKGNIWKRWKASKYALKYK